MVTYFILTVALLLPPTHVSDEAEATAKAALALSKAKAPKECGKCRTDLEECRVEALETGKPLVILVNMDCHTNALNVANAIFVRVKKYTSDNNPTPDKSRMVLIEKSKDGKSLEIQKIVEPLEKDELKKELFQTFPRLKSKMSWV